LSSYNPFRGQFHLLLFNGQQWGLWNIRGASRSDFIGNNEFQRYALFVVRKFEGEELRSLSGLGTERRE